MSFFAPAHPIQSLDAIQGYHPRLAGQPEGLLLYETVVRTKVWRLCSRALGVPNDPRHHPAAAVDVAQLSVPTQWSGGDLLADGPDDGRRPWHRPQEAFSTRKAT